MSANTKDGASRQVAPELQTKSGLGSDYWKKFDIFLKARTDGLEISENKNLLTDETLRSNHPEDDKFWEEKIAAQRSDQLPDTRKPHQRRANRPTCGVHALSPTVRLNYKKSMRNKTLQLHDYKNHPMLKTEIPRTSFSECQLRRFFIA